MKRKYPQKYAKYLVIDAALITVFTAVIVIALWKFIDAVDFFNPIDEFIDNFDYSDLVYEEFSKVDGAGSEPSMDVFIVNMGHLSRGELAEKINILQKFEPRVIGIDAVFRELKDAPNNGETVSNNQPAFNFEGLNMGQMSMAEIAMMMQSQQKSEDEMLRDALNAKDNIILGVMGQYDGDTVKGLIRSHEYFGNHPVGHLEMTRQGGKVFREYDKFICYYDSVKQKYDTISAFTSMIVAMYDYNLLTEYLEKHSTKQSEVINYREGTMPFIKIDYEDVNDSCDLHMIKDKIVLLGYLGECKGALMDEEDAVFTPLQRPTPYEHDVLGLEKSEGYDAKGIEIHAHIINMILTGNVLVTFENWQNNAIALIITFFFVLWLVYWYVFGAKFFDILSKPIQFVIVGVVLFTSYVLMKNFGIKIDMMPTGIMIIFCIEVLYLYEETLELFKIDSFLTQNFNYTKDERNKILRSVIRFEFISNKFKRSDK